MNTQMPRLWKIVTFGIAGKCYDIRDEHGDTVCQSVGTLEYAQLIVAAPQLLEALKALLVWDDGNLPGDLIDAAQQAVAQAEGKE